MVLKEKRTGFIGGKMAISDASVRLAKHRMAVWIRHIVPIVEEKCMLNLKMCSFSLIRVEDIGVHYGKYFEIG